MGFFGSVFSDYKFDFIIDFGFVCFFPANNYDHDCFRNFVFLVEEKEKNKKKKRLYRCGI